MLEGRGEEESLGDGFLWICNLVWFEGLEIFL